VAFSHAAEPTKTCCAEAECEHPAAAPEGFKTVDEVVAYILSVAPPQHLKKLKQYSKYEFLRLDFKLDKEFDERLGLSDGNTALLQNAGTKSARRAWDKMRIALWEKIQKLD